jgi:hypothetical protein
MVRHAGLAPSTRLGAIYLDYERTRPLILKTKVGALRGVPARRGSEKRRQAVAVRGRPSPSF